MSATPSTFTTPKANAQTTTPTTQALLPYMLPVLTLVGVFVCIILGKITADVGVPVIVAIAGVHAGAAVANSNTRM